MSISVNKTEIFNFGGISPMCSMGGFMPVSIFGSGYCYNPMGMFSPMMGFFNPWSSLGASLGFCIGSRVGLDGVGKAAKTVGKGIASIFKKKSKTEEAKNDTAKVEDAKAEEVKDTKTDDSAQKA